LIQLHQRWQEPRQRLAAAGRRDEQHRTPLLGLGQQLELVRARRPAARLEPAAEDVGQERFCFRAFEQRYRPTFKPSPEGTAATTIVGKFRPSPIRRLHAYL
jgi:hypothetical protein